LGGIDHGQTPVDVVVVFFVDERQSHLIRAFVLQTDEVIMGQA